MPASEQVRLRDGSFILIRPIEAADKDLLERALERLGRDARYRRFLSPKDNLTARELAYLTEVDHRDHEALIAVAEDGRDAIGVARYVRLKEEPSSAEAAVVVIDAWQNRGVATALLERLIARARIAGLGRFVATALATNREVIGLLEHLGAVSVSRAEAGLVELELDLSAPHALWRALRGAASHDLDVQPSQAATPTSTSRR